MKSLWATLLPCTWFSGLAFLDPLSAKWLGTVQGMHVEATFIILEKSCIQLNTHHAHDFLVLTLRYGVLEARDQTVAVELPYSCILALLFLIIAYPMIGYTWSAYKMLWFFYAMFCTLLYFNYLGMLVVSITPNVPVAAILSSSVYIILNLFSGFPVPEPQIPRWWVWLYCLSPTSWTMNALFTSLYGDIEKEIMVFGKPKSVAAFLRDFYGFHHDGLSIVAVVLAAFPIVFAYCIGKLNFQRR